MNGRVVQGQGRFFDSELLGRSLDMCLLLPLDFLVDVDCVGALSLQMGDG